MELEKQVVSLDLAKRLKELGVKQESFWYWSKIVVMNGHGERMSHEWELLARDGQGLEHHSAFTVAELGEMLPATLGEPNAPKQIDVEMYVYHSPRRYEVVVSDYVDKVPHQMYHAIEPTEADARAKMLIYLIENKLITV